MANRVINFNPGPAALPLEALERAQRELIDWEGTGMSVLEHSHRGKDYDRVHNEAIDLVSELCGLSDEYQVLFLQGGATQQFAQVPMNLLPQGRSADYLMTDVWSEKAYSEAQFIGRARIAASTKESDGVYRRVPRQNELQLDPNAAYALLCSNNTVMGTQYHEFPDTGSVPLVVDMSSDILSRPLDFSRFGLVFAGAQKNIGPAGVTVVIARKSWLAEGREDIPKIFRYKEHAKENSLLNTCPTFAIYLLRNVLQVLKESGGPAAAETRNRKKASLIYEMVDANPGFFRAQVERESRSIMNPVFRLSSHELDMKMVAEAKEAGFAGIKGHKLVGGIRVSIYNAITEDQVAQFVDWARGFAKRNG
ncbi:MAG TPA: 3-phosphoserine/phosphohydroxythreonine transaminase [Polyangiales bacterium]|nr:3-phosphoserine/phosphohydroxythreonine transaminase [Polyangiales bacterium]